MSLGSRSGVNWMRLNWQPSEAARLLASMVLPTPGTSSTRMWPWAMRAASVCSITAVFPTMTLDTLSTMARAAAGAESVCITGTSYGRRNRKEVITGLWVI